MLDNKLLNSTCIIKALFWLDFHSYNKAWNKVFCLFARFVLPLVLPDGYVQRDLIWCFKVNVEKSDVSMMVPQEFPGTNCPMETPGYKNIQTTYLCEHSKKLLRRCSTHLTHSNGICPKKLVVLCPPLPVPLRGVVQCSKVDAAQFLVPGKSGWNFHQEK